MFALQKNIKMAFTNPNDLKNESLLSKLKEWIQKHLGLSNEIEISYSEMRCADPACPCVQTFLKVHLPEGLTKSFRIGKPLVYIREMDILALK
jgi:hypothetical protein